MSLRSSSTQLLGSSAMQGGTPRALALAETPLHIFNLVALAETEGSPAWRAPIDLVVLKQFALGERLVAALEESGLFSSVTVIEPYYSFKNKSKVMTATLKGVLAPTWHRQKHCPKPLSKLDSDYQYLLVGCATIYAMDMKTWFVPHGETVFFEEGEGSYLGNFVKSAACFDREILKQSKSKSRWLSSTVLNVMSAGKLRFNARRLFLYRPECVEPGIYREDLDVRAITPINPDSSIAKGLFGAPSALQTNWIYLGSPDVDRDSNEQDRSLSLLRTIARGHEVMYRRHPRSRGDGNELPESVSIDDSQCLWEALCLNGAVNDETVIFGFGSTAQINPVRMFDLHPTLIFLHHFMREGIDKRCAERTHRQAVLMCGEEKVFAPASEDELDLLVEKLMVREGNCEGMYE